MFAMRKGQSTRFIYRRWYYILNVIMLMIIVVVIWTMGDNDNIIRKQCMLISWCSIRAKIYPLLLALNTYSLATPVPKI